ncbi:glycosyltransferase family 92 protein [Leuconostoc citreum]|uniref:glycosyltransferase family 92 protein n=1 Tax=Leuconostoc citreum TaxID=33964 RepID=UPI001C1F93AA|nr:glycosyltransferase family 92 protein [Leuconostoc citreum]MBU7449879.1 glycosyltransferase family 92 protein [Leuconostoc citreum]
MRYKVDMPDWKRKFLFLKSGFWGQMSKYKSIINGHLIANLSKAIDNRNIFTNELSIAAILKNEADYISEWIEFHKLIGVTKFYLFDNDSDDHLEDVLLTYILDGTVELHKLAGEGKQLEAYEQAIRLAKDETRWLAILDLDEFLLPVTSESVVTILNESKKSAMLVGWTIYGSNGFIKRPNGLVLENYTRHADNEFIADYKIIVNPRKVIRVINPHFVQVIGKTTDSSGKRIWQYPYTNKLEALPAPQDRIRINHYYSKSLEEFQNKSTRGYADTDSIQRPMRDQKAFAEHDQNIVLDHVVDAYIPKIKKALRLRHKF